MKKNSIVIWFLTITLIGNLCYGQIIPRFPANTDEQENGFVNSADHPCISEEQYGKIEKQCRENIQWLQSKGLIKRNSPNAVQLIWPVKAAKGLSDCSFYHVSAYVDLNATTGTIQDNNCGAITYDGHRGTDISIWPYNFLKMDNDMVEVIAAAPGTIIAIHDGEFDKNCAGNSLTANYVMIQHEDGSSAMYWHMKKNSVIKKTVGQTVIAGEYLGVVGSSGSSSGPHLHFEVRKGTFDATTRVDPFKGTCNSTITSSWWANQKTYRETAITKVSINTTDAVFPPCPMTETPNESDTYQIPFQGAGLAPGFAKFYIFIRDELAGLTADMSILYPDGTVFSSWTYMSTVASKTRANGFSKKLPTVPGTYTFRANYNGTGCSTTFKITAATSTVNWNHENNSIIYPNPSNGNFVLDLKQSVATEIEIFNLLGLTVYKSKILKPITVFNLNLPANIYLYQLRNKNNVSDTGKLLIE